MSEAPTTTFEANAAPVAGPQQQAPFNTYDEYAAGMDGLSFGWLYARFVEYMKLNMHPDGTATAQRTLAKRVDTDNSTEYYYADHRNFTANMHVSDPFFLSLTLPMAMEILGFGAALENATAQLADGANVTTALPPVPELLYCGVKWKGDGGVASFIPLENPEMIASWMKDVRGMLLATVAILAILLATVCLGLCVTGLRGRRWVISHLVNAMVD